MSVLSLQPAYIPLLQKPFCCAVTCLQMILYRNGLGLHDQEALAIKFGVKISAEDAPAFSTAMTVLTQANFDEGIQTVESEDHINIFLKDIGANLKAASFKHSALSSLTDFLSMHLQANHDIWAEYHGHDIHADDKFKGDYIHDGLIESFDTAAGIVTVIDPMPEHRQRLFIPLPALEKSISQHFGRETGFIVIEKKTSV